MQSSTPGNGPAGTKLSLTCTGKCGPVPTDAPAAIMPCPACDHKIRPGQYYTLFPVGCGGEEEARRRAREGLPYPMTYIAVHWACVTGDDSESRLAL